MRRKRKRTKEEKLLEQIFEERKHYELVPLGTGKRIRELTITDKRILENEIKLKK